jgi:hypothetical protein
MEEKVEKEEKKEEEKGEKEEEKEEEEEEKEGGRMRIHFQPSNSAESDFPRQEFGMADGGCRLLSHT